MSRYHYVLGIETSCDETGVALASEQGVVAESLFSQADQHALFGGVVPELASRDHIRCLLPMIEQVLQQACVDKHQLAGIACTAGPGLMGALLIGTSMTNTLGYALGCPTLGIHHLEAHLLLPMLYDKQITWPFLGVLVSGGNTLMVQAHALGDYSVMGETLDDAVGEAFDKTAKLLGLAYPGGALLSRLAEKGRPGYFHCPRPMVNRPGMDFSFSGLKTHVAQTVANHQGPMNEQQRADLAYAFEDAVVDTLLIKIRRAVAATQLTTVVISGGVSANRVLRERLRHWQDSCGFRVRVCFPPLSHCTDNGAMIAYTGYERFLRGNFSQEPLQPLPRWQLEELES